MSRYVVDASVAIKWYLAEVHWEHAHRLLREENRLLGPGLLFAEVGNIVWKQQRRGAITPEAGARILNQLQAVPFELHPDGELVQDAYRIAVDHGISVYDGIYVALASQADCELVTADRKLFDVLAGGALANHLLWIEALP